MQLFNERIIVKYEKLLDIQDRYSPKISQNNVTKCIAIFGPMIQQEMDLEENQNIIQDFYLC